MGQKNWMIALLIDIKTIFNHVSKSQLVAQILELLIGKDLIWWTKSFFINKKLLLVINGHNNSKKDVKLEFSKTTNIFCLISNIY